ncbi:hypothetical protein [Microvirga sp. TS319]|uniref:hypothetical protein n=1 Tax=Microvirga sp. TS319 TaxID=3241165 RepID=UPI003519E123
MSKWKNLYNAVCNVMAQYGTESAFGDADYWVLDEKSNWAQRVFISSWDLYKPEIMFDLQIILQDFKGREIWVSFETKETMIGDPLVGIIITHDRIEEHIDRDAVPVTLRDIRFEP